MESDHDVLATVLGDDGYARDALSVFGGLQSVWRASVTELEGVLPRDLAARLEAVRECVRRVETVMPEQGAIRSSRDIAGLLGPELYPLRHERVVALFLDTRCRVLARRVISEGSVSSAPVSIRALFAMAIREGAASLVLAHNHPSGDPTPSTEDLVFTASLCAAGALLEMHVMDHVVFGGGQVVSMLDAGLMPAKDGEPARRVAGPKRVRRAKQGGV